MGFGEKLKNLRQQSGKSQADAAREIGQKYPGANISQTYISALEKRESAPREEILRIFADYYNVAIIYFLEDANYNIHQLEQSSNIKDIQQLLRLYYQQQYDNSLLVLELHNNYQKTKKEMESSLSHIESEISRLTDENIDIQSKIDKLQSSSRSVRPCDRA